MKKIIKLCAIVLSVIMLFSAFSFSAFAELNWDFDIDSVQDIELEEEITIMPDTDCIGYFRFVPETDGEYAFYSFDSDYFDTYGYLLDENQECITEDDEGYTECNFLIRYYLSAGETYYFKSCPYYSSEEYHSYKVILRKCQEVKGISINGEENKTLVKGDFSCLEYTFITDESGFAHEYVTFESDNEDVASIFDDNYVDAVGIGTATITATTESGYTDTCTITVTNPPEIELDKEYTVINSARYSFTPKETATYVFASYDEQGIDSSTDTWAYIYIGEDEIAYGDWSGYNEHFEIVCELEEGITYDLWVNSSHEEFEPDNEFYIKLSKQVAATGIEIINGDSITMQLFNTEGISYKLLPEIGAIYEEAYLESKNEDIVVVDGLMIRAVGIGTTTVTIISENGLTDSITVTVEEPTAQILLNTQHYSPTGHEVRTFTPTASGGYVCFSYNNSEVDSYLEIFDENGSLIARNDDGFGGDLHFRAICYLTAGEKYYFVFRTYGSEAEPYEFIVRKADGAQFLMEYDEYFYYYNGIYQENTTGFIQYDGKARYVLNGVWQNYFTGLVKHSNGNSYYVQNGCRNNNVTGFIQQDGKAHYVLNGVWQKNFTGLVKHSNGNSYYVQNGCRNNNVTGFIQKDGKAHYVLNGVWQKNFTGLVKHSNGNSYYVQNGCRNNNVTGFIPKDGKAHYVLNGVWQKNYTGLVKHSNGNSYYVANGCRNNSVTGFIQKDGKAHYVLNGVWQKNFTGLVKHSNGNSYYVANGCRNNTTGFIQKDGKAHYVLNGVWQKNYTGLVKHSNGNSYYVANGCRNNSVTGFIQKDGKAHYVLNGVWQKNFTGFVKHANGNSYYVYKGCRNNITGTVTVSGKSYKVKNGVRI